MAEAAHFSKVCECKGEIRLEVIFVHGLNGDPVDTWTAGSTTEYWPKWLCDELEGVSIYALGYPASIFAKWAKKEMDLHERANNMLELLASNGIGARPIAMVCHSLGGILVKEMLRTSKECSDAGWQKIVEKTLLAIFIATPHKGAALASAVNLMVPRLASKYVDVLSDDSGYLTSLNQSYRDLAKHANITTVAYYEKHKMKNAGFIVDADSADPGVGNTRPVAVDADHISICKPETRTDLMYLSLCRHLEAALEHCPAKDPTSDFDNAFVVADYSEGTESDRRDLLKKLIDAGREHEYRKANDLQNKFAQRYYKLGLYTKAKNENDAILSAVEQRFTTHVYNAKICKGASDDEIAAALQAHVIDPMCSASGEEQLSPTAILQALYFLTEQCFIQWDPA